MALDTQIDAIVETISSFNAPPVDVEAILKENLLTEEEIVKKLLIMQSGLPINEVTEKMYHALVYGKEASESLDNVDVKDIRKKANAMTDTSDIRKRIKTMIKETLNAVKVVSVETARSTKDSIQLTLEATAVVTAAANMLATVPPQPAASAYTLLTFNSKVKSVANSYTHLVPILPHLNNIEALVLPAAVPLITGPIETILSLLNTNLSTISALKV